MNLRLGRSAKSMHLAPMKFSTYLLPTLPPLEPSTNWSKAVRGGWQMDANDSLGDCTCAAMAHLVMNITANDGMIVVPTVAQVETMYQASGWDPNNSAATDQGWTLDAANAYMVSTGLAGVKADGYVEVDQTNLQHCYYAIQLLGGVNFGVNLPQSAMDAFQKGNGTCVWDYDPNANNNILGGHSIEGVDKLANGEIRIVTWGSDGVTVTPAWLAQFADEACAAYFAAFVKADGLNVAQMVADAKALAVGA